VKPAAPVNGFSVCGNRSARNSAVSVRLHHPAQFRVPPVVLEGMSCPDQRQEVGRTAPAVVVERSIEPRVVQRQRGERILGKELRRVQQVPLQRPGKERRVANLAGKHPQQHVALHPHEAVIAVAVIEEPVRLIEALRPQ
jgi:hypothetical protein